MCVCVHLPMFVWEVEHVFIGFTSFDIKRKKKKKKNQIRTKI